MTEQQIEVAARKVCQKRGLDPDKIVVDKPPTPRWAIVAIDVREHCQMADAVAQALSMDQSEH